MDNEQALRAQLAAALEQIDTLTEAKRSVEDLLSEVRVGWRKYHCEAEAELRAAVEALRPFQKFASQMLPPHEDYSYMEERIKSWFAVAEFRDAASTVAAYDAQHPEGKC